MDATQIRIRYIGWLSSDNLGDLAVYRVLKELFQPSLLDPTIADPDAFMIGGGTLLFRGGCAEAAAGAASSSRSVFVFGTGAADPEFGEVQDKELWNAVLERCFYVGVRGFRTQNALRELGYARPVEVLGDPALLLEAPEGPEERDNRHIVVNICNTRHKRLWGGDNLAVRARVVECARKLIQGGWKVTFVSFESRNDAYVQAAVREVGGADFVNGYHSLEATMRLLGRSYLLIGEKLHSIVFAAAAGTPFISLEYRPKCRDFAESVGCGHMVLRTDSFSSDALLARVEDVKHHYDALREGLLARVSQHRESLRRAARDVRRHLSEFHPARRQAAATLQVAP
jgi:polysaccharide pyruvyl transferase WcaK-like protein